MMFWKEPEKPPFNKCIYPACSNDQHCRGLCKNHYYKVKWLVRSKKFSWKELENAGKVLKNHRDEYDRENFLNWINTPKEKDDGGQNESARIQ